MVEIEATLNNRPLTYIYDDEDGISYPFTPADLIYGRQIAVTSCQRHCNIISTFKTLMRRAKYHFRLLEGFTKQWRNEYLLRLRETHRTTNTNSQQSIASGDIVIVKEDIPARSWWKVAKVTELLRSKDNVVRAAKIQVLNKAESQRRPVILRRAIPHLIPLEVKAS